MEFLDDKRVSGNALQLKTHLIDTHDDRATINHQTIERRLDEFDCWIQTRLAEHAARVLCADNCY